jgi:hypothetical protein
MMASSISHDTVMTLPSPFRGTVFSSASSASLAGAALPVGRHAWEVSASGTERGGAGRESW